MVGQKEKAHQLDFFNLMRNWENIPGGTVMQLKNGKWEAKINGGWWTAIRESKESAIRAVTKMYNEELSKYEGI